AVVCLLSLLRPGPPGSPPFPYTTLFRSPVPVQFAQVRARACGVDAGAVPVHVPVQFAHFLKPTYTLATSRGAKNGSTKRPMAARSEEHTSELQSRENLVCRLLLEKKKHP